MGKLVSIVVPVYMVEEYLKRCIDSIISQSYKNIEVILVDDGSKDKSGEICDSYGGIDSRVKVVHRKNGGLSAARNTGIDLAKGDYILFVDSDDYIDLDLVEYLTGNILSTGSDIATVTYQLFGEGLNYPTDSNRGNRVEKSFIASPAEALIDSLYERSSTLHAWGKLYDINLFKKIRFPEGRLYEDVGTIYKLYREAEGITINSVSKYHYLIRSGSILHSGFSSRMMDSVYFAQEIVKATDVGKLRAAKTASQTYLLISAISAINILISSKDSSSYSGEKEMCWSIIKVHRYKIIINNNAPTRIRLYALASMLGLRTLIMALRMMNLIKSRSKAL